MCGKAHNENTHIGVKSARCQIHGGDKDLRMDGNKGKLAFLDKIFVKFRRRINAIWWKITEGGHYYVYRIY